MATETGNGRGAPEYPFGLSSRQLFVFVVIIGLIGPGLLVTVLESANLSTLANVVWITGYGTTIFVVWYIWVRPIDFTGSRPQGVSPAGSGDAEENPQDPAESRDPAAGTESGEPETETTSVDRYDGKAKPSDEE